jgi:hypothetical protein
MEVFSHPFCAAFAEAIACSSCSGPERATVAKTSSVAGLITLISEAPSTALPSIQIL